MSMNLSGRLPVFALLVALASCAAPPPPAPTPPPPPVQHAPPPPPVSSDWRDWPVASGNWRYLPGPEGGRAVFADAGGTTRLSLRCDLASRRVFVSRPISNPVAGQMTVRTSFGAVSWPIERAAGNEAMAARSASDNALDKMAFSRGRFAIEVPGEAPLVVPAWAEIGRVIEDCRG